ncbi:unnamed protein product [Eruca vesicaria subsp. sativa]|uniref:Clathrin assembly protein n=1 Tax=Eruca vesicaria subsp. sativa TaxID=29727 RepID=A0ABC8JFC0_ERUVS|nr:unnamed protein product [Eruca vesicaria subsp. sativa]
MEEYVKEAPLAAGAKKEQVLEKLTAPKEILAIEYEKPPKVVEEKPESPEAPVKAEAEAGGLDKLTLDSLYEDAIRVSQQQNRSHNPWEQHPVHNGPMMHQPFFASNGLPAPPPLQMANHYHQPYGFQHQNSGMMMGPVQPYQQQQQQNMNNPFGNPFVSNSNPHQPYGSVQGGYNPYPTLM